MPKYTNIINLQIEITTHCNAFCPGCARNIDGGELVPGLKLEKMEIDLWKKITQDQFLTNNIRQITFNGMFGDPLAHPKIFELIDLLPRHLQIEINSNGSFRNKEFWKRFAWLLQEFKGHTMIWGIDGMQDTHAIHRRGTDWNKIIENLKIFNSNGGMSEWRMILFEHNLHQVDQCRKLAEELKCQCFWIRQSYDDIIHAKQYKNFPPAILKSPSNIENKIIEQENEDVFEIDSYEKTLSVCPWHNTHSIQLSADGRVWPCCYTAEEPFIKIQNDKIWSSPNIQNSLKDYSIEDILNSNFFSKQLDSIWHTNRSKICQECIAGEIKGNFSIE